MCSLCLAEKTEIARDTSGKMINKRNELMQKCLHKEKFKLSNFCAVLLPNKMLQKARRFTMFLIKLWPSMNLLVGLATLVALKNPLT